jgi:predicted transcriptional regulator
MLLNIYDSKEVFVKELQVILAERLLSSKDYDVEKEVTPPLSPLTKPDLYNRPETLK